MSLPTPIPQRNLGIDLGRLVAVFVIVCLHPEIHLVQANVGPIIVWQIFCRWGVPFFFMTAGYYSVRASVRDSLAYVAHRLLPLIIAWNFVYFIAMGGPKADGWLVFVTGIEPAFHLWFLPALAMCLVGYALLRKLFGPRTVLLIALAFYAVGLAFGAYSFPLFGYNFKGIWDVRNGPFFGLIFIALGASLRLRGLPSLRAGVVLLAAGALLHGLEIWAIYSFAHVGPYLHNYVLGTLFMGLGSFVVFARLPHNKAVQQLAAFGTASFGIYAAHVVILRHLERTVPHDMTSVIQCVLLGVPAFVLTLDIALILANIPGLRRFVT